jgi:hypothetical protein
MLLASLLIGCGGTVGTVEAIAPDAGVLAVEVTPPPAPTEYGGGDTSRGVPPSLEQRTAGGAPAPK